MLYICKKYPFTSCKTSSIESLNETSHGYCVQVELQFRTKLASSTHKPFKIPAKDPRFPSAFLSSALNFRTNMH